MRVISVGQEFRVRFLDLGESGMGFQIVQAKLTVLIPPSRQLFSGLFVVFNSDLVIPYEANEGVLAYRDLGQVAEERRFPEPVDVMAIESIRLQASRVRMSLPMPASFPRMQATPAPPISALTTSNQAFFRFSASANDHRVLKNGELSPGTYATTYNDIRMVPSGLAAVGRYALPNPLPAKYVYSVVAPPDTPVLIGSVRPGFGQAGGGVEVYFEGGSKPSTFEPHEIPDS